MKCSKLFLALVLVCSMVACASPLKAVLKKDVFTVMMSKSCEEYVRENLGLYVVSCNDGLFNIVADDQHPLELQQNVTMDIIYTVFGSAVADEVGLFNPQETVNIGGYKIQTGAAEMPGQNFNITIWKTDEH